MKALIIDGKNAGRIMHLTESEIDLSDVLEKDEKSGAYRMTEADANWVRDTLREGYARKTHDEWEVQGNYGYGDGWECLCTEETRKEAFATLKDYNENERGVPHRVKLVRVRNEEPKA